MAFSLSAALDPDAIAAQFGEHGYASIPGILPGEQAKRLHKSISSFTDWNLVFSDRGRHIARQRGEAAPRIQLDHDAFPPRRNLIEPDDDLQRIGPAAAAGLDVFPGTAQRGEIERLASGPGRIALREEGLDVGRFETGDRHQHVDRAEELFEGEGCTPDILMETSNTEFIKQLVQRGEGVSFVVKEAVAAELKEKKQKQKNIFLEKKQDGFPPPYPPTQTPPPTHAPAAPPSAAASPECG